MPSLLWPKNNNKIKKRNREIAEARAALAAGREPHPRALRRLRKFEEYQRRSARLAAEEAAAARAGPSTRPTQADTSRYDSAAASERSEQSSAPHKTARGNNNPIAAPVERVLTPLIPGESINASPDPRQHYIDLTMDEDSSASDGDDIAYDREPLDPAIMALMPKMGPGSRWWANSGLPVDPAPSTGVDLHSASASMPIASLPPADPVSPTTNAANASSASITNSAEELTPSDLTPPAGHATRITAPTIDPAEHAGSLFDDMSLETTLLLEVNKAASWRERVEAVRYHPFFIRLIQSRPSPMFPSAPEVIEDDRWGPRLSLSSVIKLGGPKYLAQRFSLPLESSAPIDIYGTHLLLAYAIVMTPKLVDLLEKYGRDASAYRHAGSVLPLSFPAAKAWNLAKEPWRSQYYPADGRPGLWLYRDTHSNKQPAPIVARLSHSMRQDYKALQEHHSAGQERFESRALYDAYRLVVRQPWIAGPLRALGPLKSLVDLYQIMFGLTLDAEHDVEEADMEEEAHEDRCAEEKEEEEEVVEI